MSIFEEISQYVFIPLHALMPVGESFLILLGVAFGGAIGAYARYCITIFFVKRGMFFLPFGTLCVNLLGSFLLGLTLSFFLLHQVNMSSFLASFIIVGLCGSLTTFSTFAYDSFFLWANGERLKAFMSIFINMFGGCALALIGFLLPLL